MVQLPEVCAEGTEAAAKVDIKICVKSVKNAFRAPETIKKTKPMLA
jgi:hypothetical protein